MPDETPRAAGRRFFARAAPERPQILASAATDAAGTVTLRLYDAIDSWGDPFGVSAKEFSDVLNALPDDTTQINLRINSPGGETFDALAILNSLRSHPATVTAIVDGIAASAASVIATGVDKTVMMPNSELMIHDAWGICIGNTADMAETGGLLDHLSANLADVYASKSGAPVADMRALMQAETWLSASEAVEMGLADEVAAVSKGSASPKASFDLSQFRYQGREKAPTPQTPVASAAGDSRHQEGSPAVAFSDEGTNTLRQKLGVTDENADEATILAALDQALDERAEPQTETPPVKAEIPEGMVLVPQDVLDSLKTGAEQGVQARQEQMQAKRDTLILAAKKDGRITPASVKDWTERWDKAPDDTETLLASLPKDLVPMAARGHDGDDQTNGVTAGWADRFFNNDPQKVS